MIEYDESNNSVHSDGILMLNRAESLKELTDILYGPFADSHRLFVAYAAATNYLEDELKSHLANKTKVHLFQPDIAVLIGGLKKSYDVMVRIASKYPNISYGSLDGTTAVRRLVEIGRLQGFAQLH